MADTFFFRSACMSIRKQNFENRRTGIPGVPCCRVLMEFDIPIVAETRTVIRRALRVDLRIFASILNSPHKYSFVRGKNPPPPKELGMQMENAHCVRIALKIYGF
jgi:hypothetical protein